ncbi:MAG TPA: hypothetical protein VKH19_10190 [Gemmatimonadaceae bacterium]|nr:hypothetical protein [Gemmatimonadaceae bacterium]
MAFAPTVPFTRIAGKTCSVALAKALVDARARRREQCVTPGDAANHGGRVRDEAFTYRR